MLVVGKSINILTHFFSLFRQENISIGDNKTKMINVRSSNFHEIKVNPIAPFQQHASNRTSIKKSILRPAITQSQHAVQSIITKNSQIQQK